MSYILIIGAKSDVGMALARKYTDHGYNLYLAARNSTDLTEFANDLQIRSSRAISCVELDILDYRSHKAFFDNLKIKPIGVIVVSGYLGVQKYSESNFSDVEKIIDTNFTGAVSLLNIVANNFELQKSGFIVGVSSVAGERGRQSNYLYGSSKAALSIYLSGLRNRLHASNISVLTVKPGFIKTKMTKGMDLPQFLTLSPTEVADKIFIAQQKKKNVVYLKWIWRWIMFVIKIIPEAIFKRTSL
ncbi:SDR family oxidoreductase [Candidatus Pseudothioglobus singularis]|jgi:decaprenylphospho-beta-D-erythro-pentofuranosid-2-ulose 2-reductase|uniref:Short-chain dehydrogenase n=1 Tax=Candidatus Pseudothioglobus singularis PS1 TaxID=1125411 RepID=A0A0M4M0X1_9GAMM|nr:SDR family oxidoreductase [Candidatus Pseudothioglobus singularis]ALE02287.1 short-chain dehydrogenase [Candidatus Pseudothioglobus singularis PS1]